MKESLRRSLEALERRVEQALRSGETGALETIGYGDSAVVLACDTRDGRLACKRVPSFESARQVEQYAALVERYAQALRSRGIGVLDTRIEVVRSAFGTWSAYCVQPAIETDALFTNVLRRSSDADLRGHFETLLETVVRGVDVRVGLDADVSNWCVQAGRLTLLDLTTPMLRDERLRDELDYQIILRSLPRWIQHTLGRPGAASVLERFHRSRTVLVDVLCGLIRERIGRMRWARASANEHVSPSITRAELRRHYAVHQTTFAAFRRLQRFERWWCAYARKAPYAFLLPPRSAFAGHFTLASLVSRQFE